MFAVLVSPYGPRVDAEALGESLLSLAELGASFAKFLRAHRLILSSVPGL
jgi:hypothetical protein